MVNIACSELVLLRQDFEIGTLGILALQCFMNMVTVVAISYPVCRPHKNIPNRNGSNAPSRSVSQLRLGLKMSTDEEETLCGKSDERSSGF